MRKGRASALFHFAAPGSVSFPLANGDPASVATAVLPTRLAMSLEGKPPALILMARSEAKII
jgi:hypothetical protein